MSCTLMIFSAWASDSEPPNTVKSLAKTKAVRPLISAPAGDDAVAGDFSLRPCRIRCAVLDEHVELLERALVEEHLEPLARRQLAAAMLLGDAFWAPALPRFLAPSLQFVQNFSHRPGPQSRSQGEPA